MADDLRLTSAANPRIKQALQLRQQSRRRHSGLFLAEGRREVGRALAAGLDLCELFVCPELFTADSRPSSSAGDISDADLLAAARAAGGMVYQVTSTLMHKMAYRQDPEGVLAVFHLPRWSLEALAARGPDAGGVWLVSVGVQKPGNLGAMARSAEAAGAAGLIVADGVVDAFNPNAIRASTGAVFALPLVAAPGEAVMAFLRDQHIRPVAATPDATRVYTDTDLTGSVALIIGPEDAGLPQPWRKLAQTQGDCVRIPMLGRTVDSLNASVAASLLLFEARRQRQPRPEASP